MSYTSHGSFQLKDEEAVTAAIKDVRDDAKDTNYVILGYESGKSNCIELVASGSGGLAEVLPYFKPDFMGYSLVRVISGDKESHRPKFIEIIFSGEGISLVKKGKMGTHVSGINQLFGYTHISVQASSPTELDETDLMNRVKKASGADYDSGSNKNGY